MPKTLLLADDSVTIQKVVGISFANEDVVLLTVDNGDDALSTCRNTRPDIVLADVVMPGKNGYEVCEAIKSDPSMSQIPVLLLTGTFEAFDEERAQNAGADGHITKPFEAQALVDQVDGLLARAAAPQAAEPAAATPTADEDSLGLNETPPSSGTDEAYDFFDDEMTEPGASSPNAGTAATSQPAAAASAESFSFDGPIETTQPAAAPATPSEPPASEASAAPAMTFDPNSRPDETIAIFPDAAGDSFSNAQTVPPPLEDEDLAQLGASVESELVPESAEEAVLATIEEEFDYPATHPSDAEPIAFPESMPGEEMASPDTAALADSLDQTAPPTAEPLDFGSDELSVAPEPEVIPDAIPVQEEESVLAAMTGAMEPSADAVLDPDGGRDYDVSSSDLGDVLAGSALSAPEPDEDLAAATVVQMPPIGPEPAAPEMATAPEPPAAPQIMESTPQAAPPAEPRSLFDTAPPTPAEPEDVPLTIAQLRQQETPIPVTRSETAMPETAAMPEAPEPAMGVPTTPVEEPTPAIDTDALREQIHATLEKVAWEALGPVTEAIVKEAVSRVEKIAWEVIPQMAETLIQEEIRKLKGE